MKNKVIIPVYLGEFELENILRDDNWKKLGACEISCLSAFDSVTKVEDVSLTAAINERIIAAAKAALKPKTTEQLLKDQIDANTELLKRVEALEQVKSIEGTLEVTKTDAEVAKEYRAELFIEAKELSLTVAKNIKTVELEKIIAEAKK